MTNAYEQTQSLLKQISISLDEFSIGNSLHSVKHWPYAYTVPYGLSQSIIDEVGSLGGGRGSCPVILNGFLHLSYRLPLSVAS